MQLRRLESVTVKKKTKTQRTNGSWAETYTDVGNYKVIPQELNDDVSASVYGAELNLMLRLSSVNGALESFLKTKMNNEADNISEYTIVYNSVNCRIMSVQNHYVDIKL